MSGGAKLSVGYGKCHLCVLCAALLFTVIAISTWRRPAYIHSALSASLISAQSKWIAELILLKARDERGLPITIFRPGYVTGDSKTGVMNTDDYLVRLLKGCLQLGKVSS